jgi:hypothetical protein
LETKFGGDLLFFEGHSYTKFRVNADGTISWRCKKKCGGWLRQLGEEYFITKPHDRHNPSPLEGAVTQAKIAIKKRALSNPHEKPSVVLDEVLKNFDLNAKPSMPKDNSSKTNIARIRRKAFGISGEYAFTERGENFILYDAPGEDRLIVFSTIQNIQNLSLSSVWMCDGTFKSCPKGFEQIYTVHAVCDGWVHPFVYALLPNRKMATYAKLLNVITSTVRGVNVTPEVIICDFEQAFIKAVAEVLPTTDVQGCLYHLSQSIGRNLPAAVKEKLREGDTRLELIIKQLSALAFLPPVKVESTFHELRRKAEETYPEIVPLFAYFKKTYISDKFSASKFSIPLWSVNFRVLAGFPRSNNAVEGWNNRLNNKTNCSHPGLFSLIKTLRAEQSRMEEAVVLRQAGDLPRKRAKYLELDARIRKLVVEFDKGLQDPLEFVEGMAHNLLEIRSVKKSFKA